MWRPALGLCVCAVAWSCAPRQVELGFWIEPQAFQSPRIGEPITTAEYDAIERTARDEITKAFADYDVVVSDNRNARFRVVVEPSLKDWRMRRRSTTYAGESR